MVEEAKIHCSRNFKSLCRIDQIAVSFGGMMMSALLGRRLRGLRRLKRLTQKELAGHLGIPVSMLSTIERGGKYPRAELLKKIARVLDVSAEELFVMPEVSQE